MSPIDDELRAALQSRAAAVAPAPDPLGGIEARARGIRRRRSLAAVSGTAAVVVALAVAVPLVVSSSGKAKVSPPGATTTSDDASFDLKHPWPRRGIATPASLQGIGPASDIPLFAQHAAGRDELFSIAHPDNNPRLGYDYNDGNNVSGDSGRELGPLQAFQYALQGDDGRGRLVVIAAPDAVVDYSPDGLGWQQISGVGQAPKGIGLVPIEPREPNDSIRVTEADGTVLTFPADDATGSDTHTPVNVLTTWVHRGEPQAIPTSDVEKAFDPADQGQLAAYRSLYDGTRNGVRFTIGQAWFDGAAAAHTVALDSTGAFFLGPETPRDPWLIGAIIATGSPKDLLVLLPRPGAGRVGYSPDATTAFSDVASGRSDLNAVGLVDRDPTAQQDRVQVHRGDDSIIVTEGIATLTCGAKECG